MVIICTCIFSMAGKRKRTQKRPETVPDTDGGVADEGADEGADEEEGSGRPDSPASHQSDLPEDDMWNEKIVDFIEDHPHFFDMALKDYKNKERRNFELSEFASVLGHGWTPDKIWKRFVSLRTEYGKLLAQVQKGKSGSGARKYTRKQQWKMTRLQFLNPHMKRGNATACATEDEIGKVRSARTKLDNID